MILEQLGDSPLTKDDAPVSFFESDSPHWQPDLSDSENVPDFVNYVPLGSEIVHTLGTGESESDEDGSVHGDVEQPVTNSTGFEDVEPVNSAFSFDLNVDRLLSIELDRGELEPRGPFGDSSLYTNPLPDTTQVYLWNSSVPSTDRIVISNDKADEIRNCMANFSIPSNGVPPWATAIPEDLWKQRLLERLNVRK
ncbi:unnamed protein product [Dicrocoelium dendriticum]|nr:unnamed protein product [Dicrocoelium dendriticum]